MFLNHKYVQAPSVLLKIRTLFTNKANFRDVFDRKEMLRSLPVKDDGTRGEESVDLDSLIQGNAHSFPTSNTSNMLFGGVPFKNLPIINIRVTHNNSVFTYTDCNGKPKLISSCGIEGFRNARKGTTIAAQATAISFGTKVLGKGTKTVRVRVRGLGPGRTSGIKGLQMAGVNIVSITDSTRVSWTPPRARKQRKL